MNNSNTQLYIQIWESTSLTKLYNSLGFDYWYGIIYFFLLLDSYILGHSFHKPTYCPHYKNKQMKINLVRNEAFHFQFFKHHNSKKEFQKFDRYKPNLCLLWKEKFYAYFISYSFNPSIKSLLLSSLLFLIQYNFIMEATIFML